MAWGDAVSRRWRRRDLAPRERRRAPKRHDATRRRDNWTYKGVPMDTSIRDTEGRAPLYLYYEHCYGPFVDREDARRLYEKYPRYVIRRPSNGSRRWRIASMAYLVDGV